MPSSIAHAGNDDVIMAEGEKAAFNGVLVPPDNYRKYSEAKRIEDFVNQDKAAKELEATKEDHSMQYGLIGLAVGFVGGVLLVTQH